jgi:hypothetical protein
MHTPEHEHDSEMFVCPKTGRCVRRPGKRNGWRWGFTLLGLGSLIWFLLRVLPKPSRAFYPCMRLAAPLASGFVVWLLGAGAALAFLRAWKSLRRAKYALAGMCLLIGLIATWATLVRAPLGTAHGFTPSESRNAPIGVDRGVNPGRVAWAWDPDATQGEVKWDESTGFFWDDDHNNQAVIDDLMGKVIRWLAGEEADGPAWDALFRHHNITRGRGDRGYQPGEKIAIKFNLNASLDRTIYHVGWDGIAHIYNPGIYAVDYDNEADHTPHAIRALLWQLTTQAGVPQQDIYIYDSIRYWTDKYWNFLHAEFPGVHFMDVQGYLGREQAVSTADPVMFYSKLSVTDGQLSDRLPAFVVDAAYMIDFAILKKTGPGITVCGKNHFGTITENPVHLHEFIRHPGYTYPWIGDYSAYVDFMAHPEVGGKTFLYLVDAIWAGWGYGEAHSMPVKWQIPPFNNDWPSSLFASQDPVAIDSVALDFLSAEDATIAPNADSYLHEAALIPSPPSGTAYDPDGDGVPHASSLGVHEHWNNSTDKQYSRNLGLDYGIELVSAPPAIWRALNVASTPVSGVTIAATPSPLGGDTPYAATVSNGAAVSLTAPGETTVDSVRYRFAYWTVNDTQQPASQTTCALTVSAATTATAVYTLNSAPVAVDDSYPATEDVPLVVSAPGVLANDTDEDDDALTAVLGAGPAQGTLALQPTGAFTYTPPPNFHGTVQFTYTARDAEAASAPATVTITVAPVNDAPVAQNGGLYAVIGVPTPGTLLATDVDGDVLTFEIVDEPGKGTVLVNAATGAFTYTANAGASGDDAFTFRAFDQQVYSNTATITLNISGGVNSPPVAVDDSYAFTPGATLTVGAPGVLGNDSDSDGDAMTTRLVTGPAYGKLTLHRNGSFTYRSKTRSPLADQFTYRVSAGRVWSDTATVLLIPGSLWQPDLLIGSDDAGFLGDDIYNRDGDGQTQLAIVSHGITARYHIRIQNDGADDDTFVITGPASADGWRITYLSQSQKDITAQVTDAGWEAPPFRGNVPATHLWVLVTPDSSVPPDTVVELLLTAASQNDPTKKDAVKAVTRMP